MIMFYLDFSYICLTGKVIDLWCAKHLKGFKGLQVLMEVIAGLNITGNFSSVLVSKLGKIFLQWVCRG